MTDAWLIIARDDLSAAEAMYHAKQHLHAAFMCQQAVEKALKGLLQRVSGNLPPRIHSLERLAQLAEIYNEIEGSWPGLLSQLEPFYIQARYPEYREQMKRATTKERAESLLNRTKELVQWVLHRIDSAKS